MENKWLQWWHCDRGQDVAEYAVLLAVILIIVVATAKAMGGSAVTLFSRASTAFGQVAK